MAELGEVYGQTYHENAQVQKMKYAVNILANNISHLSLQSKFDTGPMWNGNNLKPETIPMISKEVISRNQKLVLQHIDKTTRMVNMFPYLIEGPVEYFRLINLDQKKIYLIYVTPTQMEPY